VFLPEEARRPLILHFDPSLDPVLELSLSGRGDAFQGEEGLRRLRRLADLQVKRILEPIKGIAAVRVQGGLEEEIHILLEEEQLRRTNISIQRVIDRLSQENINVAGGMIQEGRTEYLVRTVNEYTDLQQMEDTIVDMFDGREVRVGDLGRVARTHKERQIITRTDGRESVHIQIFKEADANIVALAKRVKAAVGEVKLEDEEEAAPDEDLTAAAEADTADTTAGEEATTAAADRGPHRGGGGLAQQLYREEGAVLQLVADRSIFIESSIKEVRNTAILGGLLAIVVLFLFLRNFRTTVIIAASIPISLLVTFAPLHLLGVSLNIMSLGGLALGIGMLVDSSIVVLESIHRCREEGDDIRSAAIRGTAEVRAAVTASILTSIAVFFPMVFVEGVAGQAFGDLGVAVVVSLLASLAVAVFFIPMLASRRGLKIASLSETGPALGTWSSWQGLKRSFRESRRWKKLLVFPVLYWILRFVIGLMMELIGKLALLLFMTFVFVLNRYVIPAARVSSRVIWTIPLRLVQTAISTVQNGYPTVLRWALARPLTVLGLVALTFLVTWQVARGLDSELLPEVRQGEFTVEVSLPVGTPLEETETILSPI
jgi:HAE1 family hydrophobic/amphiphilic exporter-1